MKYLFNNIKTKLSWLAAMLLTMTAVSCNEDLDNPLQDKYPEPGTEITPTTKVLIMMLDGASGSAVNDARNSGYAPNIKKMLWNSLYTFNGLADNSTSETVTRERGWANIMTGLTSHGVFDRATLEAAATPSMIKLAQKKSAAVFANDKSFADVYAEEGTIRFVGEENTVFDKFEESLADNNPADLNVIQYSGIYDTGEQSGYTDESGVHPSAAVLSGIAKADAAIGKIKDLLNERRDNFKEDWLLIVSSTNGGVLDNSGDNVYDMKDRNTFVMVYHPKFSSELQMRPGDEALSYSYYIPVFTDKADGPTNATVKDASLFDIVFDKDNLENNPSYTIQFLYKQKNNRWESTGNFVSKVSNLDHGEWPRQGEGWTLMNDYFRSKFVASDFCAWGQASGTALNDTQWHTVTTVIDGSTGEIRLYIDGTMRNNGYKAPVLNRNLEPVDAPLVVGRLNGNFWSRECDEFYITNLQIYDVALPEKYIEENYTRIGFDKNAGSFKYWDNLVAYWPMDREEDYESNIIPDYSKNGSVFGGVNAGKSDMILERGQGWLSGQDNSTSVTPTPDASFYQFVFNNVDIPYQALQWLNVPVELDWKWEGIGRSLPFSTIQSEK